MISFTHKLLFTHPQKCGGTSIEELITLNDQPQERMYKHWSLKQQIGLIKNKGYNPDEFLKFSIIRNPWDRVVSGYHYAQLKKMYEPPISFEQYVELLKDQKGPKMHTKPFMFHRNSFALDFVIKLESLHEDIKILQQQRPDLIIKTIPHTNSSSHLRKLPYQHYYNTKNKNFIEAFYQWDIETFEYSFD